MNSGRELDQLIDHKVMGAKPTDWSPNYSTDIKAAWSIVEKLQQSFRVEILAHDQYEFSVAISTWDKENVWAAQSESAALAICNAALKVNALP